MRAFIRWAFVPVLTVVGLCLLTPGLRAEPTYYVMLFGFEGKPRLPRTSHTFAVYVKVEEDKEGKKQIVVQPISWCSTRANTKGLLLKKADAGVNIDLAASMQLAKSVNAEVTALGPYQIKKELYDNAMDHIAKLNSGAFEYKALDAGPLPKLEKAINCIHAVAYSAPGERLNTGVAFGVPATEMVSAHLSRWYMNPDEPHAWLIDKLDLRKYPITYAKHQKAKTTPDKAKTTSDGKRLPQ